MSGEIIEKLTLLEQINLFFERVFFTIVFDLMGLGIYFVYAKFAEIIK